MSLDKKQKVKLLKSVGAKWYIDAVREIEAKKEKKQGGSNAKIL